MTVRSLGHTHGAITASLRIDGGSRLRWSVQGHLSRRPGTGQGRELRNLLIPDLLAEADRVGVIVEANAATGKLAAACFEEIPGFVDVGAWRHFGRRFPRAARPSGAQQEQYGRERETGEALQRRAQAEPAISVARARTLGGPLVPAITVAVVITETIHTPLG